MSSGAPLNARICLLKSHINIRHIYNLIAFAFLYLMPPKKNKNTSKPENPDGESSAEVTEPLNKKATLEALLDSRLEKQSDHLNNLFSKFSRSTKCDLDEIKQTRTF